MQKIVQLKKIPKETKELTISTNIIIVLKALASDKYNNISQLAVYIDENFIIHNLTSASVESDSEDQYSLNL